MFFIVKVIHPVDPNIVTFPSESTPDFKDKISQVKTIIKLQDNTTVVGAVNMLAKFSMDLKLIKKVKLEPSAEDITKCGDDVRLLALICYFHIFFFSQGMLQ